MDHEHVGIGRVNRKAIMLTGVGADAIENLVGDATYGTPRN